MKRTFDLNYSQIAKLDWQGGIDYYVGRTFFELDETGFIKIEQIVDMDNAFAPHSRYHGCKGRTDGKKFIPNYVRKLGLCYYTNSRLPFQLDIELDEKEECPNQNESCTQSCFQHIAHNSCKHPTLKQISDVLTKSRA